MIPALLQMLAMAADEGIFHRRRGLPLWERIGHPLDTLTVAACYAWLIKVPPTAPHALLGYVSLAAFSSLFITKDEFVHSAVCNAQETWLHALLFVLHPIVFMAFYVIWVAGEHLWIVQVQFGLTLALVVYQVVYWSILWKRFAPQPPIHHEEL